MSFWGGGSGGGKDFLSLDEFVCWSMLMIKMGLKFVCMRGERDGGWGGGMIRHKLQKNEREH